MYNKQKRTTFANDRNALVKGCHEAPEGFCLFGQKIIYQSKCMCMGCTKWKNIKFQLYTKRAECCWQTEQIKVNNLSSMFAVLLHALAHVYILYRVEVSIFKL